MEHKGYRIAVSANVDASGKCCDASYVIHRLDGLESIFAGAIAGIFPSVADAELAALHKAKAWIDEHFSAS